MKHILAIFSCLVHLNWPGLYGKELCSVENRLHVQMALDARYAFELALADFTLGLVASTLM